MRTLLSLILALPLFVGCGDNVGKRLDDQDKKIDAVVEMQKELKKSHEAAVEGMRLNFDDIRSKLRGIGEGTAEQIAKVTEERWKELEKQKAATSTPPVPSPAPAAPVVQPPAPSPAPMTPTPKQLAVKPPPAPLPATSITAASKLILDSDKALRDHRDELLKREKAEECKAPSTHRAVEQEVRKLYNKERRRVFVFDNDRDVPARYGQHYEFLQSTVMQGRVVDLYRDPISGAIVAVMRHPVCQ